MRLVREPGTRNGEWGKKEWGAGIVVRNPKIDKFPQKKKFFLMLIFLNLILVKLGTYYRGFKRAYCL
jgi:hypothetical protein